MSPTLENAAVAGRRPPQVKLVSIVPGQEDLFPAIPPGLLRLTHSNGPGPDWMEVMRHMALRLTWVDPGFAMDVFAHDAPMDQIRASAADADVFVTIGIKDETLGAELAEVLSVVPTGAALGCCSTLDDQSRVVFQPATNLRAMEAQLIPWGQAAKDLRLMEQVIGL